MGRSDSQRLFFALWPDLQTRSALQQQLPGTPGKTVHPEDLHLTLRFLGQVPNVHIPCLLEAADSLEITPFTLILDHLGYWKRPAILWAGLQEMPGELTRLVRRLQVALGPCGFPAESRHYRPHITLARKVREADGCGIDPISWRVDSFALVSSRTGGEPPRYNILRKWPADS